MNRILLLLLLLLAVPPTRAHDHVEVGEDPSDSARLGFDGPTFQLALYVPPGEPFSGYVPNFPGNWFANELTFTTDVNALNPAAGADPRIELVSVNGPPGGSFAFWEVGVATSTWSRPVGWTNAPGDVPSFPVVLGGDNHAHGRAFSMDTPGTYSVVVRAVDAVGPFLPSAGMTITFVAQPPPALALSIQPGQATLSFTSRLNLDYDLQACTNLAGGAWTSLASFAGDGTAKTNTTPLADPPGVLFRLVEFQ